MSNLDRPPLEVRFQRGVHLPGPDLWLDPHDRRDSAFVSHAHSDHIGRHREIILTPATAALMQARLPGERIEHRIPFDEPFPFRGQTLTLLPAGHVLGSAQLFAQDDATGASLLYTGDFKLRPGLTAEAIAWRQADTLIMETTFGLPQFRFPPTAEVIAQMVEFCRDALAEDAVPVLFGYSLGKAQEILCALAEAGLKPMLHAAVQRMVEIYRGLRPDFPPAAAFAADAVAGHVLICPPGTSGSRVVQAIKNRRTAVLTGWAVNASAAFRYGCDAAFPLSDHADYPDLLHYVELVRPRRVLTLHGYAREFAADLRRRGIEAWALGVENQLEMVSLIAPTRRRASAAPHRAETLNPPSPESFRAFAQVGAEIARSPGKRTKVQLLAGYLGTLDDASLPLAARFLTGRIFARSEERVAQAGWAIVKRAILSVSRLSESELRQISAAHGDQAETAREALTGQTSPGPFSITDARSVFEAVGDARGPIAKAGTLAAAFRRITPEEAATLIKILSGDLRIGLKEGLLEEAIATASAATPEDVRHANMLLGDIGRTATLARHGKLASAGLTLFQPVKVMLASPEPSSEAIWQRVNPDPQLGGEVWLEDKFDGIRAQIHVGAGRVEIYSRDLRRITAEFEDLAAALRSFPGSAVFDGEIIARVAGRTLTFFDLQKRLGRTGPDLFLGDSIPVVFAAFDLLMLNGEPLLGRPLRERRAQLERVELPAALERVDVSLVRSVAQIESAFLAARERSNEGLIAKDPESIYFPGRRGLAWLKLKKEFATLDVVVVAAEWGHGKRHHVLSDVTFAVRDTGTGALLPIGKAYSGLTDAEIAELTTHFLRTTIATRGRVQEVEPAIVLEIAFDSIQASGRHASGLALRFPRIKAIRRDKTAAEIDTLAYARSLVTPENRKPRQP